MGGHAAGKREQEHRSPLFGSCSLFFDWQALGEVVSVYIFCLVQLRSETFTLPVTFCPAHSILGLLDSLAGFSGTKKLVAGYDLVLTRRSGLAGGAGIAMILLSWVQRPAAGWLSLCFRCLQKFSGGGRHRKRY